MTRTMQSFEKTSSNRLLPDPGYQHPGYIDVLVPPPPNIKNTNHDGSEDDGLQLRRPLVSTPGYDIEQCDRERWIQISAAKCVSNATKKRKRPFRQSDNCDGDYNSRHKASWNAFQPYLEKCIPVKIRNVALLRDISLTNASQNQHNCDNKNGTNANIVNNNENGEDANMPVLSSDIALLPSTILETTVTVQCVFPPLSSRDITGDKGSIHFPSTPPEIDEAISFSNENSAINNIPTFMGQEDQVTTEMTLREAITWDGAGDSLSSSAPSMAVCVAQEQIVTTEYESLSSTSVGPAIQQHESSNDNPNSKHKKVIQILSDGKVKQSTPKFPSKHDTPMTHLSSMLRLPSYLLLGDPDEACKDGNDHHNSSIVIHNINLWYAPQTSCTNVHYDEQDNLLLVTDGVKTVELCPPGCLRGSGIYSDHANHPALLRMGRDKEERIGKNGKGESSTEKSIRSEMEITRDLKRQRTHIVSISAGEGLYIPSGWWHRVVSTSAPNCQTGKGCTAINVWFTNSSDYASRTNVPSHMVPFQLRHAARKYYEIHADYAANVALERKRQDAIWGTRHGAEEPKCSTFSKEQWKSLRGMTFTAFVPTDVIRVYGNIFTTCWVHFMQEVDDGEVVEEGLIHEIISRFRKQIEYFLLFINLADAFHVQGLVRMWTLFPPPEHIPTESISSPIEQEKSKLFTNLILGFSPESCFIITQAWERHASSTICDKKDSEVESSYKHFFELAGNENEKQVRSYLMNSVEDFRCKTCQSYLMEGILLGKI